MQASVIMRPIRSSLHLRHTFSSSPKPNPNNPLSISKSPFLRLFSSYGSVQVVVDPISGGLVTKRLPPIHANNPHAFPDDQTAGTRVYGDVIGSTSNNTSFADEIGTSRCSNADAADEIGTRRYGDVMETSSSNSNAPPLSHATEQSGDVIGTSRNNLTFYGGGGAEHIDQTWDGSRRYREVIGRSSSNSEPHPIPANEPYKSIVVDQSSDRSIDAAAELERRSFTADQRSSRRHGELRWESNSNSEPHPIPANEPYKSVVVDQSSDRSIDAADELEKWSFIADQNSNTRMYEGVIGTSSSGNSLPYTRSTDKLEKRSIIADQSIFGKLEKMNMVADQSSRDELEKNSIDKLEKMSIVADQSSSISRIHGDVIGTSSRNSRPYPIAADKPERRSVIADQSSPGSRIYRDAIGKSRSSKSEPDASAVDKPHKAVKTSVVDESSDSSLARNNYFVRKGKGKSVYVCSSCGFTDGQWWGSCRECGVTGGYTLVAAHAAGGSNMKVSGIEVSEKVMRSSWIPKNAAGSMPIKLSDVRTQISEMNWRIPLPGPFGTEVDRVLGGGLVLGSLVLVGGDPGVGKSTMLLQIAALIARGEDVNDPARVIYVSGEESVQQIGNRANRLNINMEELLYLYSSTDVEDIMEQAQHLSPKALVVDSIQTVYLRGVAGSAGSDKQVKECTLALLHFAKKTSIPVFLIGHVTKAGEIAGPHMLEHIVDVVLYLEGEKLSAHRLLRPVKNRFGSTDELGVFEMSNSGLQAVSNPSKIFLGEQHLSQTDYLAGQAIAVILDGSRAFLIEVQALCVVGSSSSRHVNGIQASRADMLISVLTKQAGLKLQENGIYLNVISGTYLNERAGDLAIAAAICSSYLELPVPNGIAFIAEIGLGGELRMVPQLERRVNTLAKLGFKKCIVPKSAEKSFAEMGRHPENLEIVGCRNLKEMMNIVFS